MANYAAALKTARMTATRDHLVNGTLEIGTAGMATVLATFTITGVGGSVTGDVWTVAFVSSVVNATAAGTAGAAQIKDSVGTVKISGLTVGTSGANVNLVNLSIANTQEIELTSGTITHAA